MLALLLVPAALAHGDSFELVDVSVSPDDPDAIWGVVQNQGLVWTEDGGNSWTWRCDSALGATRLYDVVALGGGRAAVALLSDVLLVDTSCGASALSGFPEDAYADHLTRAGDAILVAASGGADAGLYRCDDTACGPTALSGEGLYVKSILPASDGFYATTVLEGTLAAELWFSEDGQSWTSLHAWPDGDLDPRAVYTDDNFLFVWTIPRATTGTPALLRSTDGGQSFAEVWRGEEYTSAAGTLLPVGDALVFGHEQGLTMSSHDAGLTWTDHSDDLPTVLCGDVAGSKGYLCADHLYDGIDLATSEDGWTWTPIACLEEAVLADCASEACAAATDNWATGASIGGGRCDEVINPLVVEGDRGCGCGGKGDTAGLLVLPVLALRRRRRKV